MSAIQKRRIAPVDYAVLYALQGIAVFPLAAGAKVPRGGSQGFLDATTDEAQIRAWWSATPRANIAGATGGPWVVIDADLYKMEPADRAALEAWNLPPTKSVRTTRGGLHYWYRVDEPLAGIPEGLLLPHVCIKAEGGYVVMPPSTVAGKPYAWLEGSGDLEVATLPENVAEAIRAYHARDVRSTPEPTPARSKRWQSGDAGGYWLDAAMRKTSAGNGDATGYWLAQQLLIADANGGNVHTTDYLEAYAHFATLNERDPFGTRDVDRWLRSAERSRLVARAEPAKSRAKLARERATPVTQVDPDSDRRPVADVGGSAEPAYSQDDYMQEPAPIVNLADRRRGGGEGTGDEPPAEDLPLGSEADDNGNAEFMRAMYGRDYLYTPAYGWLEWSGTHWRAVPDDIVTGKAILALKKRRHLAVDLGAEAVIKATKQDRARVTGCTSLFRSYVIEPDAGAFDADPDLLNCRNGVLDLRTGALSPHDPAQRFTYCLGVDYDAEADSSAWLEFIGPALGDDPEILRFFQLACGYSLTGDTKEEKLFYLYGPTRAGKGTVTETLLALMPHPLGNEADFVTFTARRENDSQNFDLAELKPARIVVASESNAHQSLNPAKIKHMTGGNITRCAFKHKDMFSYRPQYKVWLVSNHAVNGDPEDDALWGRVLVFHFPNSHLGAEDMTLKARLKSPENLRGVLRWAVEGARAWYASGLGETPDAMTNAKQEQRDKQDYVRQWLDDSYELEAGAWTPSAALMANYTAWCEAAGVKPRNAAELADSLTKRFGCVAHRQAGTGRRGYSGIRLKSVATDA